VEIDSNITILNRYSRTSIIRTNWGSRWSELMKDLIKQNNQKTCLYYRFKNMYYIIINQQLDNFNDNIMLLDCVELIIVITRFNGKFVEFVFVFILVCGSN